MDENHSEAENSDVDVCDINVGSPACPGPASSPQPDPSKHPGPQHSRPPSGPSPHPDNADVCDKSVGSSVFPCPAPSLLPGPSQHPGALLSGPPSPHPDVSDMKSDDKPGGRKARWILHTCPCTTSARPPHTCPSTSARPPHTCPSTTSARPPHTCPSTTSARPPHPPTPHPHSPSGGCCCYVPAQQHRSINDDRYRAQGGFRELPGTCFHTPAWHPQPQPALQQQTNRSPYQCEECGQLFKKEVNWQKHIIKSSMLPGEGRFQCHFCSHVFPSKFMRKHHHTYHFKKIKATDEFNHRCLECGQRFSTPHNLNNHHHRLSFDVKTRNFKCYFCSHSFRNMRNRNEHESVHGQNRKLLCCCCDKIFHNRKSINSHRKKKNIQPPPQCTDCGVVFGRSRALIRHLQQVKRDLPFKCTTCHHSFSTETSLKRHSNCHQKRGEFQCASCLARFLTQKQFDKHLNG